jgi:hypothetical protein
MTKLLLMVNVNAKLLLTPILILKVNVNVIQISIWRMMHARHAQT